MNQITVCVASDSKLSVGLQHCLSLRPQGNAVLGVREQVALGCVSSGRAPPHPPVKTVLYNANYLSPQVMNRRMIYREVSKWKESDVKVEQALGNTRDGIT
jgi:hypothetical protein